MKKLLRSLVFLVIIFCPMTACSEEFLEVRIDGHFKDRVVITSFEISKMCKEVAKNFFKLTTGSINFLPIVEEKKEAGDVWEVSFHGEPYVLLREDLPKILQKIRGNSALKVKLANCFLESGKVYKTEDFVIMTASEVEAEYLRLILLK